MFVQIFILPSIIRFNDMKKLNNWDEISKMFSSLWASINYKTILVWFRPYVYTKEEVENIVKRIINQDSFGDVHHEAAKVAKELDMSFMVAEVIEYEEKGL